MSLVCAVAMTMRCLYMYGEEIMTLKFKAKYSSFLMYKKNSVKCYTPEPRTRYSFETNQLIWNRLLTLNTMQMMWNTLSLA